MLHSALDRAVKERLLIRNPADSCVVPKVQHQEMKTLQPEDLKAYLDAAEKRGALAMFYLELVSGIRKGELVALRWEDLDIPNKTISVSKQATKDEDNHLIVKADTKQNSAPVGKPNFPAGALRCSPVWVTVWVNFFRRLKVITFCIAKHPENNCFRGVSWS